MKLPDCLRPRTFYGHVIGLEQSSRYVQAIFTSRRGRRRGELTLGISPHRTVLPLGTPVWVRRDVFNKVVHFAWATILREENEPIGMDSLP